MGTSETLVPFYNSRFVALLRKDMYYNMLPLF